MLIGDYLCDLKLWLISLIPSSHLLCKKKLSLKRFGCENLKSQCNVLMNRKRVVTHAHIDIKILSEKVGLNIV